MSYQLRETVDMNTELMHKANAENNPLNHTFRDPHNIYESNQYFVNNLEKKLTDVIIIPEENNTIKKSPHLIKSLEENYKINKLTTDSKNEQLIW